MQRLAEGRPTGIVNRGGSCRERTSSALRVTIPATMCRDRTVGEERTTTAVVMCTQDEGRVLGKPGLVVSAT